MKTPIKTFAQRAAFSLSAALLLLIALPTNAMSVDYTSHWELRVRRVENVLRGRARILPIEREILLHRINGLIRKFRLINPLPVVETVAPENFVIETEFPETIAPTIIDTETTASEIVVPNSSSPQPIVAPPSTPAPIVPVVETIDPILYTEIFNGYGQVNVSEDGSNVQLDPMHATEASKTHAALVVSQQELSGNYRVSFDLVTESQSRTGSPPNPWEVGWFVFGYKPDGKFKYLILKPEGYGIELGESLTNDAQNFLWTSTVGDDSFDIGQSYAASLEVSANEIIVNIGGVEKLRYTMTEKDTLDTDGKFGFYTEDAAVKFSNIRFE